MQSKRWLLPEGVQETVPPESWRLEAARRALLDLYWRWGYELIRPPLIEYLDSLLTGAGHELDLHTFKLTDQLNGRMMGVRSDMTTQATRIDAHRLAATGPARYCYIGSVLRTRPDEPGGSRSPLQVGVEKFGDGHLHSDLEIVSLMLETLHRMGIERTYLDLGHVAIYRRLVALGGVSAEFEPTLFDVVQRKSRPDLDRLLADGRVDHELHDRLATLIGLNGPAELLQDARAALGGLDDDIDRALDETAAMVALIASHYPDMPLFVDLAELRGYRYKTGLLFAAFAPGLGRELARGGRYDNVGSAFGRPRPATGFSADLNLLAALGEFADDRPAGGIFAPPGNNDESLLAEIRRLRASGERVVVATPDHTETFGSGCDRILKQIDGAWQVRPLQG
ncbi:ATP phosphoribosyltransferase regulatory subunit [Salinisphaera hydrothermalis]|uniref:ATP phosphoribosyltransferase regulatory subunit n=1 Tax=Salinisphaera hydrothermalis (strain C41B8) TaxID=1304275 RepID=A0A084ILV6_SALHC|nr:ATP phosphoribosyltransferase regulatory subunit [Salinisphaera hydrothermalis]KEZ77690.1 histidyl-tRNA synthetase 2 [Salinisphaera hydrothermalis C41B8]